MKPYRVSLTTKLKPPQSGLIAIEPEDYTDKEIAALKKSGAKVLAYLSVGSVSNERSYYKQLRPYALKKLENWEHERYLDLTRHEVRKFMQDKAKELKDRGFDGCWLDNIDVYEEYRTTEMFTALVNTLRAIKAVGGYVMLNGGIVFITDLLAPHKVQLGAYSKSANAQKVKKSLKAKGFPAAIIDMDGLHKVQSGAYSLQDNADNAVRKLHEAGFTSAKRITLYDGRASTFINGVTQEEVFSLIVDYDKEEDGKKGIFGVQEKAESERYQSHMRRVRKSGIEGYLLEYTRDNTLKLRIKAFCDTFDLTACISDDKDL